VQASRKTASLAYRLFRRPAWQAASRLRTAWRTATARIHPRPILITGNQKSGTTAIAALLAELTGRTVTLDLAQEMPRPTFHLVRTGQMTVDAFVRRNKLDFSREIVKEPNLVVLFDRLAQRFPDSPWVFVVRDPRDNIRSILNRLDLPGNAARLERPYAGLFAQAWNLCLDGAWLNLAADTYIETLAARWTLAVDTYLANRQRMAFIRYEDFEAGKVAEIERLARELGLTARHDITGKLDVAYQPRGDRSVPWHDFFGPENLAKIEHRCRAAMEKMGYEPA